jgi:predicted DNA-binding transcriptional regulator AlpA
MGGATRCHQPHPGSPAIFRFHRRRYVSARHIAQRLGVSAELFLGLYKKPVWRVPRPRVIRDRAHWDMVEVEHWLDTLAQVQPTPFEDWLAINGHHVAPYTVGWSLLEALRPRWGHWPVTPPASPVSTATGRFICSYRHASGEVRHADCITPDAKKPARRRAP